MTTTETTDQIEIYDESSGTVYVFATEGDADHHALTGEENWLSHRPVEPGEFEGD